MKEVKWEEMSWPEIEEVLKVPNAVILPVGSIEQHGLHLPVNVDCCIATHIAEQAARKVTDEHKIRVLVAPVIHYTETQTFRSFPGTIGVTVDTFIAMVGDIVRAFVSQGFNNIIVLNAHSTNTQPIAVALRKASLDLPKAGLYAINWWALGFDVIPNIRKSKIGSHAEELETSMCLVIQPEKVHLDKAVNDLPKISLSSRWIVPDLFSPSRILYHPRKGWPQRGKASGVMGEPTVASRETGEKAILAVVDDLARVIVEIVKSEGANP